MYQFRVALNPKQHELLLKIIDKTGVSSQELCRQAILTRYFELFPISKTAQRTAVSVSNAVLEPEPEKKPTKKEFIEHATKDMDLQTMQQWLKDNKHVLDTYDR